MADSLFLLVGLGNPGDEYIKTRHNIGFMMLDDFAERHRSQVNKSKMQGTYCTLRCCGAQLLLLQPQTYMNRSGECVRRFVDYYKVKPGNILVLHDDIDMPYGRIKAVAGGGAGGHNGIKSIISHLGTNAFARLKIGVGRPSTETGNEKQPVNKYVLSRFSEDELAGLDSQADIVSRAVEVFVEQGISACMNTINGLTNKK